MSSGNMKSVDYSNRERAKSTLWHARRCSSRHVSCFVRSAKPARYNQTQTQLLLQSRVSDPILCLTRWLLRRSLNYARQTPRADEVVNQERIVTGQVVIAIERGYYSET
jgi:hypothetical protein